jgi:hypothetical protein
MREGEDSVAVRLRRHAMSLMRKSRDGKQRILQSGAMQRKSSPNHVECSFVQGLPEEEDVVE